MLAPAREGPAARPAPSSSAEASTTAAPRAPAGMLRLPGCAGAVSEGSDSGSRAGAGSDAAAGPGAGAGSHSTSMRVRILPSTWASSGANASPNRKLAMVSVTSNGSPWPAMSRNAAGVWLAPSVQV